MKLKFSETQMLSFELTLSVGNLREKAKSLKSSRLSKKCLKRGLNYHTQGYTHEIKVFGNTNAIGRVDAKCWKSTRKSEKPHRLTLEILKNSFNDAGCTCTAGQVRD